MKKISLFLLIILSSHLFAQENTTDILIKNGEYKKAILLLEESASSDSKRKLTKLYSQIGKLQKAYDVLNSITQKTVFDSIELTKINYRKGNKIQALISYEYIYSKHPKNLLLGLKLANIYYKNEDYAKAIKHYKILIKKDSTNSHFHYKLARSLSKNNQEKEAVAYYKNTILHNKNHSESMYYLADYYSDKNTTNALFYINKALVIKPNDIRYLKTKTRIYYLKHQFNKSINTAKEILTIDPESAYAYNSIGLSFYNQQQLDSATVYEKKAVKLAHDNAEYHKNLGLIYEQNKKYMEAQMMFYLSLNLLKETKHSQLYHLGLIALKIKRKAKAISYFKKAYENNPNFYGALYMLATTSESFYKDKSIALKHYKRYLMFFEKSDKAKTAYVQSRIAVLKEKQFFEKNK